MREDEVRRYGTRNEGCYTNDKCMTATEFEHMLDEATISELRQCPEWIRLLRVLMNNPWGEATVVMKYGKPVMVKGIREDVKLTRD